MGRLQQFSGGQLMAWAGSSRNQFSRMAEGLGSAMVPTLRSLPASLARELVAGHGNEKFQELLGVVDLILARRRPYEKAVQHRLANVHGIEQSAQPGVVEAETD